jgi:hypothetical protein
VDVGGPEECWLWRMGRYVTRNGVEYGRFKGGITYLAHRFSFYLAHGRLPYEVRHSCPNSLCVNPAHLTEIKPVGEPQTFIGTRARGVKDLPCPKCGEPKTGRTTRGDGRVMSYCLPCKRVTSAARRSRVSLSKTESTA